jgi:hypothetical protein
VLEELVKYPLICRIQRMCGQLGVGTQFSASYVHHMLGKTERPWRTLRDCASARNACNGPCGLPYSPSPSALSFSFATARSVATLTDGVPLALVTAPSLTPQSTKSLVALPLQKLPTTNAKTLILNRFVCLRGLSAHLYGISHLQSQDAPYLT